jgi:hypothetical protein
MLRDLERGRFSTVVAKISRGAALLGSTTKPLPGRPAAALTGTISGQRLGLIDSAVAERVARIFARAEQRKIQQR